MAEKGEIKKILDTRYGEWWQNDTLVEAAKKRHGKNVDAVIDAIEYSRKKDRPIEILVIHGSSRSSPELSCAHELSNSQMLLEKGLEAVSDDERISITRANLRDYNIEPCNSCVSTCSALCGFPCNCFPFDPMQKLYPMVLKADIILMSTGVNQSSMSTRLKAFCDRLISLDGGFFVDKEQYAPKNSDWRDKCLAVSASGNFEYNQRMFGKVCAYFLSSKDQNNPSDSEDGTDYAKIVSRSLWNGFNSFGFIHPDPYYAVHASNPDEEYMFDKENLSRQSNLFKKASELVGSCIELHKHLAKNPPKFEPGRKNRT
jgi:multimeric flavodoxin WrbA